MEIITRRQRMSMVARKLRREDAKTIGLVPTMGALHEGHLSLVREARRMCDVVVVSIFVNPTQFGPNEDYERYPRNLTQDTSLLAGYNVDYIFAPSVEEIYPKGFATYVTVEGLSDQLEGASRPGHFRGVATVLTILFNIVRPDFAFFGQKDAQQTVVVKRLVRDLAFDTEIVVLPTVREASGLAMSSRNAYLNEEERRAASVLYRALARAEAAYLNGERSARKLLELVREEIATEPLVRLDYVSLNDAETLEKLEKLDDRTALLSLAAYVGNTRLIDNVVLHPARQRERAGLEIRGSARGL
ncbi:pantoate--beta-alanine ligase [Pyrinomonas methylaliphatogenes]|jgi:pantoate--beta-alanine ligase|uniref:Pantothenate synthetase n=1 Tax=Pyrinomonas methylaliphatogenes TaxID=454194 RepID=A0A0B6WST8_9BACT|nr:pantoate--beta-alanine ligase [Pyrinomonas methylaliphatogenes]MBX5479391.1 pantoate--beta-alanine ligase [Pyrinomonas methylaliphatogenes]CDM64298.1 pantothenate synthetase [Pyrinomonas methylaliphatogenes]